MAIKDKLSIVPKAQWIGKTEWLNLWNNQESDKKNSDFIEFITFYCHLFSSSTNFWYTNKHSLLALESFSCNSKKNLLPCLKNVSGKHKYSVITVRSVKDSRALSSLHHKCSLFGSLNYFLCL